MVPKGQPMHIDTANKVTMSCEPTDLAMPLPITRLVFMPTPRTLATGSSFRASEARNVSLFAFMREVIDVLAIFPQGHPLIMMPSVIVMAYAVRIANKERTDLVGNTEVHHLPAGFMAHVSNTTFSPFANLVPGMLQFLPPAGIPGASALQSCNLPKLLAPLSFERADTTPRDNDGFAAIRRHGSEVDFTQVNGGMDFTRGLFGLRYLNTDVQLKTVIPHQRTGATLLRQVNRQDQRGTASAHWQDNPPHLFADGLCRPANRIEAFAPPGVLHLHLWMLFAQFAGRFDVGKKGMHNHLYRLAMQSEAPFAGLLQGISSRPLAVSNSGVLVKLHAQVPDGCRFHLCVTYALEERGGQMVKGIDTYGIHALSFFCLLRCSCSAVNTSPFRERLCSFAVSLICSKRCAGSRIVSAFMPSFIATIVPSQCNYVKQGSLSSRPLERGGTSRSHC